MGQGIDIAKEHLYRLGHPIAREIISRAANNELRPSELIFNYTAKGRRISALKSLINKSGTLAVYKITVEALEKEDYIITVGFKDDGALLKDEQSLRFFSLPAKIEKQKTEVFLPDNLKNIVESRLQDILENIEMRNTDFFDDEMTKLEKWAEDLKKGLETDIKNLDKEIKQLKRESKKIPVLKAKVKMQRRIKELERKRKEKRMKLYEEQDNIEDRKDKLINNIEKRLKQKTKIDKLFRIRWKAV